jgi:predicted dehydrogenase
MVADEKIACNDQPDSCGHAERIGVRWQRLDRLRSRFWVPVLGGHTFSSFTQRYPDRARVVAVADPRTDRRDALADQLGVAADLRFDDWRHLAARARLADAVIIATPDREHVGPACRFAELGYHVLLEKPIAQSHLMAFAAERSRLIGLPVTVWD